MDLVQLHRLDYVVGSVHHVNGIPIDYDDELYIKAERSSGSTESLFCDYFDHQFELLKGVRPEIIGLALRWSLIMPGHFDVVRLLRPNFLLTPR